MRQKKPSRGIMKGGHRAGCKSPSQVPSGPVAATHAQHDMTIAMLTGIASAIARQDERHEHLVETIKGVENRLSDRTRALENTVDHLARKVEGMDGTINVMQGDMKVMQADMTVMKADITFVQRDITVMQRNVGVMQRDIDVMQRDIDVMQGDIKVIDGHVANLLSWKHKVWGMAILAGALLTLVTGAWGVVGGHVRWQAGQAGQAIKSNAPTSAGGVPPLLMRVN